MNADLGRIRLLLGDAVDGSHAPDERFAVDRDHTTSGEQAFEDLYGAVVIRVAEYGGEDDVVRDVKVCVTRGQAFEVASAGTRAADNTRHR